MHSEGGRARATAKTLHDTCNRPPRSGRAGGTLACVRFLLRLLRPVRLLRSRRTGHALRAGSVAAATAVALLAGAPGSLGPAVARATPVSSGGSLVSSGRSLVSSGRSLPDAPVLAAAPEAGPPPDPDLADLSGGHSFRTNYRPANASDRYGRAQILVEAPLGIVHRLILDYGRYKEFTAGKFHTSRVIGKTPLGTDVYFQLSVLGGMIALWQVFRFQEIKPLARGWVIVEGWYVKGNIGRGNAAWTLHAIDENRTMVTFDLLIVPDVPLPQSVLDDGLRNAAGEAVEAIRARAQEAARDGTDSGSL